METKVSNSIYWSNIHSAQVLRCMATVPCCIITFTKEKNFGNFLVISLNGTSSRTVYFKNMFSKERILSFNSCFLSQKWRKNKGEVASSWSIAIHLTKMCNLCYDHVQITVKLVRKDLKPNIKISHKWRLKSSAI